MRDEKEVSVDKADTTKPPEQGETQHESIRAFKQASNRRAVWLSHLRNEASDATLDAPIGRALLETDDRPPASALHGLLNQDPNPRVRIAAAQLLADATALALSVAGDSYRRAALSNVDNSNLEVRRPLILALSLLVRRGELDSEQIERFSGDIDPVITQAVDMALARERERRSHTRRMAVEALIGKDSAPWQRLRELAVTDASDWKLCSFAARVFARRSDALELLPELALGLQDEDASARALAAYTLGCYGTAAKGILAALKRCRRDPDKEVEAKVRMAIKRIRPSGWLGLGR